MCHWRASLFTMRFPHWVNSLLVLQLLMWIVRDIGSCPNLSCARRSVQQSIDFSSTTSRLSLARSGQYALPLSRRLVIPTFQRRSLFAPAGRRQFGVDYPLARLDISRVSRINNNVFAPAKRNEPDNPNFCYTVSVRPSADIKRVSSANETPGIATPII